MKKVAMTGALLVAFLLAGCGSASESADSQTGETAAREVAQETNATQGATPETTAAAGGVEQETTTAGEVTRETTTGSGSSGSRHPLWEEALAETTTPELICGPPHGAPGSCEDEEQYLREAEDFLSTTDAQLRDLENIVASVEEEYQRTEQYNTEIYEYIKEANASVGTLEEESTYFTDTYLSYHFEDGYYESQPNRWPCEDEMRSVPASAREAANRTGDYLSAVAEEGGDGSITRTHLNAVGALGRASEANEEAQNCIAPIMGEVSQTREETTEPDNGTSNDDGDLVAEAEEAVGDYYRAVGSEDWTYTYEHLDSQTQAMFTEEEWRQKNQYFTNLGATTYHVLSVEPDDTSEEPIVEVRLRLTGEDGSSRVRTTYFVREDGEWRHRFAQEEIDLFRPDLTYEEFVAAQ